MRPKAAVATVIGAALATMLAVPGALAHGGKLDRYGCHHDRRGQDYHCHRAPLAGRSFPSRAQLREHLRAGPAEAQAPGAAAPIELCGRVIAIDDGDSLTFVHDGRRVRLRLFGIDAPEHDQPHASAAREALAALVLERPARAVLRDVDGYGRGVVRLYVGGLDVNAELVRRGAAWMYRRYTNDPELARLEDEARAARRGLWSLPASERVPPWRWRRR